MASKKNGTLAKPKVWWKHMKEYKKRFWHDERQIWKKEINKITNENSK